MLFVNKPAVGYSKNETDDADEKENNHGLEGEVISIEGLFSLETFKKRKYEDEDDEQDDDRPGYEVTDKSGDGHRKRF